MREKNSELNDANEEWWDTVVIRVWANAEQVDDDKVCFIRQMSERNDELVF